jgi:hypothetical protein
MQPYQFIIYVKCISWQILNSYENLGCYNPYED